MNNIKNGLNDTLWSKKSMFTFWTWTFENCRPVSQLYFTKSSLFYSASEGGGDAPIKNFNLNAQATWRGILKQNL